MLEVDPGFEPAHVLTASLSLPAHDYPAQSNVGAFFANLEQRLEAEPGVEVGWICLKHSDRRPKVGTLDCAGRLCQVIRRRLDHRVELPHPG